MSDATNRQRRNLIISTIALILTSHAGMEFGKDLRLFGASVLITNPSMLISFLLLTHVYFSWRFYQYFHVDNAYSALKGQYKKALNNKLDNTLMAYIFASLPRGVTSISGGFNYSDVSRTDNSGGCYDVKVDYPTGRDGEYSSELVSVPVEIFRFKSIPIAVKFLFRGKILTDYYLPFILAIYALVSNVVLQGV